MTSVTVTITDATGSRRDEVEAPSQEPAIRVIAAVVQALGLPLTGPDGQPMSYRFHHSQSQSQLRDEMSLEAAGVRNGDTLRLIPEITAG
jgi:uncharacterized ubiquitin-like protein YukD